LFCSLRGLARFVGVGPATIHRWKKGGLPYLQPGKHGGRIIIEIASALAWMQRETISAANGTPLIEDPTNAPIVSRTKIRRRARNGSAGVQA
jgi:hypothetical protein